MAKFYTNSTGTVAVRLESVNFASIQKVHDESYELVVMIGPQPGHTVTMETGSTIGQIQQLATPLLTALDE